MHAGSALFRKFLNDPVERPFAINATWFISHRPLTKHQQAAGASTVMVVTRHSERLKGEGLSILRP